MKYTKEQVEIQASCYRLLNHRIEQHYFGQGLLPSSLQNDDDENDAMVGTIARWILEENCECLKPQESI